MRDFFKINFQEKREVNYFYFSFFLIFLIGFSLFHYLYWEVSWIFIFYGIGQAIFEVFCLILIATVLKKWAPRWVYHLFISASFFLLLLHFTNFTMVRLMDVSVNYAFKFLFGTGIVGLQALNLNGTMTVIIALSFFLVPLTGLGFYLLTYRCSRLKPLSLSLNQMILSLGLIGSTLFALELLSHPFLKRLDYDKYQKTLPFGTTFIPSASNPIFLPKPFAFAREEEAVFKTLPKAAAKRPNIYLFVIETFRRDYLDAAPNLTAFGKEHIEFARSFANSNTTHLSWFSIFHSDIPFHWKTRCETWKGGSLPLQYLKELGYKIHVYSSADLNYYNMDSLLFGPERKLLDTIEEYTSNRSLEPCERDALAFSSMKRDLEKEGNVYLIFLDSTHSEYSFPKDFPLKYEPIAKEIDYLTIGPKSPELELIKNRYRNAIHYVDHLMGQFFTTLKSQNLFDDAIIAITGDHGEEFFEEGALFHGTHLNPYQTSVPIFLKFPAKEWTAKTDEATHIDLFPSIIHYLTQQKDFNSPFDGKSIFSRDRHPFRTTVLQNGSDNPIEFSIEKPDLKLQARFIDPSQLEIIQLQGFLEPGILLPLLQ